MIVGLLLFGFLLTYYEVSSIRDVNQNELIEIIALKNPIEAGVAITTEDIKYVLVDYTFDREHYFSKGTDVVGKKLAITLNEGTLLMDQFIKQESDYSPEKNNAITSLKVLPEEFICWQVGVGDRIDLVHVSFEHEMTLLGEVLIKGIFDQNLKSNSSMPTYVVVEGEAYTIERLILLRDQGRIEAIKR